MLVTCLASGEGGGRSHLEPDLGAPQPLGEHRQPETRPQGIRSLRVLPAGKVQAPGSLDNPGSAWGPRAPVLGLLTWVGSGMLLWAPTTQTPPGSGSGCWRQRRPSTGGCHRLPCPPVLATWREHPHHTFSSPASSFCCQPVGTDRKPQRCRFRVLPFKGSARV